MFPPRYAGMEEVPQGSSSAVMRFPRATRGWKDDQGAGPDRRLVSPALRGDGRANAKPVLRPLPFPPRYAGMEDG